MLDRLRWWLKDWWYDAWGGGGCLSDLTLWGLILGSCIVGYWLYTNFGLDIPVFMVVMLILVGIVLLRDRLDR